MTILAKVGIALFFAAWITGSAWYIKTLIEDRAVLEASLASTTAAFGNYATNVEAEVDAYAQAVQILGERDIESRKKRDEQFASIENRDLEKMAARHPNNLVSILTGRTQRMLSDLTNAGDRAGNPDNATSSTPRYAEPETD